MKDKAFWRFVGVTAFALAGTMWIQTTHAQDGVDLVYKPTFVLGQFYAAACENLGGVYVNNHPTFIQGWSCEGIDWCAERPETYGCLTEDVDFRPISYLQLKGMFVPRTARIVYSGEL